MLGLEETYRELHEGVVGRLGAAEAVRVVGPEALSYLQGQLSQDLDGLEIGGAVESLLLSPQGKLVAYVRAVRVGEQELLVVADAGYGEAALERLARFKLRVKATLSLEAVPFVALRGPGAPAAAAALKPGLPPIAVSWPGEAGLDVLGADGLPDGVAEGDVEAFEAARIEAGRPAMGSELTEATIPPEAGIVGRTVSFTKGCYTGQELVARLDARGNRVPRLLRGVVLGGRAATVGGQLALDGKDVGVLTSVARSPRLGASVALAYVRREVTPPAELDLKGAEERLTAQVLELPLVPA